MLLGSLESYDYGAAWEVKVSPQGTLAKEAVVRSKGEWGPVRICWDRKQRQEVLSGFGQVSINYPWTQ